MRAVMRFYEVHDEDGCLIKTRNFRTAKKSAVAFLSMSRGRTAHIKVQALNSMLPTVTGLDPATRTWSALEPVSVPAQYHPAASLGIGAPAL